MGVWPHVPTLPAYSFIGRGPGAFVRIQAVRHRTAAGAAPSGGAPLGDALHIVLRRPPFGVHWPQAAGDREKGGGHGNRSGAPWTGGEAGTTAG